jgi:hypothetical protein
MQKTFKLVVDVFSGVYDLLEPYADGMFYDFATHEIVPNAVYVISRKDFSNVDKIRQLVEQNTIKVVFSNPIEGSETLAAQCDLLGITDLIKQGKILVLGGGNMDSTWPCLPYEYFVPRLFQNEFKQNDIINNNVWAILQSDKIFSTLPKPYKFLFLNGRSRPHRKYLIEWLDLHGLLNHALWSLLDSGSAGSQQLSLIHNGQDLMYSHRPLKLLDSNYELQKYQNSHVGAQGFVKYDLFNNEWGELYINPVMYTDTYFSVIAETVFCYPHSFRTEKLWKPVAMGHPFLVAANQGYYQDLQNLGFKTFGHLIDESFDQISSNQDRVTRVAETIKDLCQQDLVSFLLAAKETCKYNQQLLGEYNIKILKEFPSRFFQFLDQHFHE